MGTARARLAVVGAGLIGRRHAEAIVLSRRADLVAIVDPAPAAAAVAADHDAAHFATLDAAIAAGGLDGAILATPNRLHREGALALVAAGLPVLVEKPICSDLADAGDIVVASERAGVAVAVGHHRRHNPLIGKAKALIAEGRLGRIATVHAATWFFKPDDYFHTAWRRQTGAGPVYLNLIHDIDLLQHLCGPVEEVQAVESRALRGHEVEDTAVILLRFAGGALGTLTVSDTAVAPWSWELTARENPAYPATGEDCYWIAGTEGALSLPTLRLWSHAEEHSWWAPIGATSFPCETTDPLVAQAEQFAAIILDGAAPLVSAREGFAALAVVEAVKQSAAERIPARPASAPAAHGQPRVSSPTAR